jgi:hypothetical protein
LHLRAQVEINQENRPYLLEIEVADDIKKTLMGAEVVTPHGDTME